MDFPTHGLYSGRMDDQAERLLRSILKAGKAETPYPWPALYLLALHAHRYSKDISGSILSSRLLANGFSPDLAERFGAEFDRYRELLTIYDGAKPFRAGHPPK
jgi:hypothetical protein